MAFTVHERLAADTLHMAELDLCTLLLMRDHRFPWTILVPRRDNLRDYHDLPREDALQAFDEIVRVSNALSAEFRVDKLNVAALGNQVPQLHIHVIGRYETDDAWPGPVWNAGPVESPDLTTVEDWRQRLGSHFL
ncbi:MAG: HIT family protein [Gammaproteobacteria bacterium]|nr:HIT family protein [Gammaproteobacteria bacterium]